MSNLIYKVCDEASWRSAVSAGVYHGSPDDLRDGFIHFSRARQLETTLRKHYAGREDLLVIAFDPASLGPSLRDEPSRGGELFPHLYGPLDPARSLHARPLRWNGEEPLIAEVL